MQVDIHWTNRNNTFLAVRAGDAVPSGWTTRYWKTLDLVADQPRTGLDPKEVIADIERQGWSAIGARVEVKVVG